MAILSVFPSPIKQQQVVQTLNQSDETVSTQIIETWLVEVDDPTYQNVDILGATDGTNQLPIVGLAYAIGESGIVAFCTRVQPERTPEVPTMFAVQVEYALPQIPPANVKFNMGLSPYTQTAILDKNNKPIVNSAGQPFDPSLTKTYYDFKFSVSWQTLSPPPVAAIRALAGQVNNASVTITASGGVSLTFAERELKLEDASLESEFQNGAVLWTINLPFTSRVDGFVDNVLDQGYAVIADGSGTTSLPATNASSGSTGDSDGDGDGDDDGDDGDSSTGPVGQSNLLPVTHADGTYLNAPHPLDGNGNVLAEGKAQHYITFKIENEGDFSPIISAIPILG